MLLVLTLGIVASLTASAPVALAGGCCANDITATSGSLSVTVASNDGSFPDSSWVYVEVDDTCLRPCGAILASGWVMTSPHNATFTDPGGKFSFTSNVPSYACANTGLAWVYDSPRGTYSQVVPVKIGCIT